MPGHAVCIFIDWTHAIHNAAHLRKTMHISVASAPSRHPKSHQASKSAHMRPHAPTQTVLGAPMLYMCRRAPEAQRHEAFHEQPQWRAHVPDMPPRWFCRGPSIAAVAVLTSSCSVYLFNRRIEMAMRAHRRGQDESGRGDKWPSGRRVGATCIAINRRDARAHIRSLSLMLQATLC